MIIQIQESCSLGVWCSPRQNPWSKAAKEVRTGEKKGIVPYKIMLEFFLNCCVWFVVFWISCEVLYNFWNQKYLSKIDLTLYYKYVYECHSKRQWLKEWDFSLKEFVPGILLLLLCNLQITEDPLSFRDGYLFHLSVIKLVDYSIVCRPSLHRPD